MEFCKTKDLQNKAKITEGANSRVSSMTVNQRSHDMYDMMEKYDINQSLILKWLKKQKSRVLKERPSRVHLEGHHHDLFQVL